MSFFPKLYTTITDVTILQEIQVTETIGDYYYYYMQILYSYTEYLNICGFHILSKSLC